jgi:hypothetical protein
MNKKIYIAFPDFSTYPTAPTDMSACTLEKCPECGENCWVSEKKKEIMNKAHEQNDEIYAVCYICMEKELKEFDSELIENSTVIKI